MPRVLSFPLKKRPTVKQVSKQLKSLSTKIKRQRELKYHDTTFSSTVSSVGSITTLSSITQGDGATNRDGNQVNLVNLRAELSIVGADATNIVRVLLVQASDSSRSGLALTDIFETPSDPMSLFEAQTRSAYKVLYDRMIPFSAGGTNLVIVRKTLRNFMKRVVTFQGSGVGHDHAVALVLISDSSAVSHPNVHGHLRLQFTDS